MKKFSTWIPSAVTIIVLLLGLNYSNGQQAQVIKDTVEKVEKCDLEIKALRKEQADTNEKLGCLIHQLEIAIAELKTETRILNRKRNGN
jgi:hypothetical protein